MTSSLTSVLEKITINSEQLRREIGDLKTDNAKLRTDNDAIKDENNKLNGENQHLKVGQWSGVT